MSTPYVPGYGGLLAGTEITKRNFKKVAVEHVREHDMLMGGEGHLATASSEKVIHEVEAGTVVYGFQDYIGKPWFLASAVFYTPNGLAAIDPNLAKRANPWLSVHALKEGDSVKRIVALEEGKPVYDYVPVHFVTEKLSKSTVVYGVHTREGPREFHAYGYLLFQNYPEITSKRFEDGLHKLNPSEQEDFVRRLQGIRGLIYKAMGPVSANVIYKLVDALYPPTNI